MVVTVGKELTIFINVSDPDGDPTKLELLSNPSNMTGSVAFSGNESSTTRTLTWTPAASTFVGSLR